MTTHKKDTMSRVRRSSKAASKQRDTSYFKYRRNPKAAVSRADARAIAAEVVSSHKELKRECTSVSGTLVPGTWHTQVINLVAQGDTADAREGLAIYEQGATIRIRLQTPTDRPGVVRIMVVRAKEVTLTTADLPTNDVQCIDATMMRQFDVIRDFNIDVKPISLGAGATGEYISQKIVVPKAGRSGRRVHYTGAASSDLAAGSALYLCMLSGVNSGAGTDNVDHAYAVDYRFKEC